ncbi:MAG: DNA-directed RNA polymerase subunit H [Candidatus Aenigmarchaeota archaeon]|nr:DNA-directed RNA polymerase subunit H [Candidatus Aenigmarchaeota archaeon]MCX8190924.1 DNA-directed RNA polymerase subunit H [Candidatus Aenigmarchaeota archaeon]MDW8160117.1 DNA-directed RNA polymerase subunit H [Candidatus Aenigmarchaeota archaeon]
MKKIDVSKHELVPKHEIVTEEEKKEIVEKYGSLKNLPRIYSTDPQVKILNAKPGDVIKITRKSETAGETIYYRIVIEKGE